MKIQVTVSYTYKKAIVEETHLVYATEDEVLDYFGANSIDCKGDTITNVEVLQ